MTNLSDALDFSRTIGIETRSESAVEYERGGGLGALGAVDLYTRSTFSCISGWADPLMKV